MFTKKGKSSDGYYDVNAARYPVLYPGQSTVSTKFDDRYVVQAVAVQRMLARIDEDVMRMATRRFARFGPSVCRFGIAYRSLATQGSREERYHTYSNVPEPE